LLYVNGVIDIFDGDCICKLYADDIQLYSVLDNANDCSDLQHKLNELQQWSDKWQLTISYKKCSTLFIGSQRHKPQPQTGLVLGDTPVPQAESVKDFGVIIDNCLKFDIHINHIVTSAHRLAILIRKCFVSQHPLTLTLAFTTYVRPLLEYATCVWSSHCVGLAKKLSPCSAAFLSVLHAAAIQGIVSV